MEKEQLLNYVAPCSLLCYTCTAFRSGPVSECAHKLYIYLDGFCEMCGENMTEEERGTWYAQFDEFHGTLRCLSGVCPGCRKGPGMGCIEGCVVPSCAKEHGVDFCAECSAFPCQKAEEFFAAHSEKVMQAWKNGSRRLQEIALEAYFEEKRGISHYLHYKEQ